MRVTVAACIVIVAIASGTTIVSGGSDAASVPPIWAYGTDPDKAGKIAEAVPEQGVKHLPGSTLNFTVTQIQDQFAPADWYPGEHSVMPEIVAHGSKPTVWACALCHYPNGKGKPENAGIAGLPVSYFVEQMHEFRDGQRRSADPRKKNTALMSSFARAMTDQEIEEAARYFGALKWTPWIKVVETRTVPKTRTSAGMYIPISDGGTEPLGERIIEVPINPEGTEVLRDPHSGFLAYVPIGSIAKGRLLVTDGAGKTSACSLCHGTNLNGLGPVPGLAGRSLSYLVRQLYDMQQNTRSGPWTELMKSVVHNLSQEDMLNIAAYTCSLQP